MPIERHYWIQIEGRKDLNWNMAPRDFDRMHGMKISASSPGTDLVKENVLILRRYRPPEETGGVPWSQPDDRKINPWDMNEPDPSTTNGTIPGPVLECNVGSPGDGEDIIVHFRNGDERDLPDGSLLHSLHPHGITFPAKYDGAYPFSPPDDPNNTAGSRPDDPDNRITDEERELWERYAHVTGDFKMGDRVPPGATFTYRWSTFGWPSTAGVWLYHDHSLMDVENVRAGAIGFLVVHNPDDPDDVFIDWDRDQAEVAQFLPDGSLNGSPVFGVAGIPLGDKKFRKPPSKALYLQLYHELTDTMRENQGTRQRNQLMAINGRVALGNTPSFVGGIKTKMRFGLVAMNNSAFHTFHIHGHRWVIPGPSGSNVGGADPAGGGVQDSIQNSGVSQFEDTRVFGPASAFSFTINQGSFMGPPLLENGAIGEWHMHCHVLQHMMSGGISRMMGSLVIVGDDNPQVKEILQDGFAMH